MERGHGSIRLHQTHATVFLPHQKQTSRQVVVVPSKPRWVRRCGQWGAAAPLLQLIRLKHMGPSQYLGNGWASASAAAAGDQGRAA